MQKPRRPELVDFGLTEETYQSASRRFIPEAIDAQFNKVAAVSCATGYVILCIWIKSPFFALFYMGWAFAPSMIIGMVLYAIAGKIETYLRRCRNPVFDRAVEYRQALAQYDKVLSEYAAWLEACKRDYWLSLSGRAFEAELAKLFRRMGMTVKETPVTGDGGVDLILTSGFEKAVVQCKAHGKKIPIGVARELAASMVDFKAHCGIIACFHGVTKPVRQYTADKHILVLDLNMILQFQSELQTLDEAEKLSVGSNPVTQGFQKMLEERRASLN